MNNSTLYICQQNVQLSGKTATPPQHRWGALRSCTTARESSLSWLDYWASMSKPHTSVFDVEFCLCGTSSICGTSQPAQLVSGIVHYYCHHMNLFCLLHRTSMSNSETMLVRHRQREGERTATGTQDKRAAVLRCLHVATSLSLTQCFIGYFQRGEFASPPLPQNETLKTIVIFTVRLRTVRHSQHSMTLLLSQSSYDSEN